MARQRGAITLQRKGTTMTQQELNAKLAAILTTLAEVPYAPESMIYLAVCGGDINEFGKLKALLVTAGLVDSVGSAMTITAKGRAVADKINAAVTS
jgi:hypothetical protein